MIQQTLPDQTIIKSNRSSGFYLRYPFTITATVMCSILLTQLSPSPVDSGSDGCDRPEVTVWRVTVVGTVECVIISAITTCLPPLSPTHLQPTFHQPLPNTHVGHQLWGLGYQIKVFRLLRELFICRICIISSSKAFSTNIDLIWVCPWNIA